MAPVAELIQQRLRRLRDELGLSRGALSSRTVQPGDMGVQEGTIVALEKFPGRVPEADIIEKLARALDVEPGSFYEYPIALARREARPTPTESGEAREREAAALRERAQRRSARPEPAPDTRPARRRRQGGAS